MNASVAFEPSARELVEAVSDAEYARLLGLPRTRALEGDLALRAQAARAWYAANGRPWVAARRSAIARLDAESVALETGRSSTAGPWPAVSRAATRMAWSRWP